MVQEQQIKEFKFPNKVVKFRFHIENGECRMRLSKFLTIVHQKYTPEIFHIKELEDIRRLSEHLNYLNNIKELFDNKTDKKDLLEAFNTLSSYWKDFYVDLKAYIIASFNIEYSELQQHLENKFNSQEHNLT